MTSLLSRYDAAAAPPSHIVLPVALLFLCVLEYVYTPSRHSLVVHALAWAGVCAGATAFKTGWRSVFESGGGKKLAWIGGGLLALVLVGERAVEGRGLWWAKALIPLASYLLGCTGLAPDGDGQAPDSPPASPVKPTLTPQRPGLTTALVLITCSALVVTFTALNSNSALALGLSNAILQALAFCLIERARSEVLHTRPSGKSIIYSANGLLAHPTKPDVSKVDATLIVIRDVSMAAMLATAIAACFVERLSFDVGLSYPLGFPGGIQHGLEVKDVIPGVLMIFVDMIASGALLFMIQRQGAMATSFVPLSAAAISQLFLDFSSGRLWFAFLCAASVAYFLDDQDALTISTRAKYRAIRLLGVLAFLSFGILAMQYVGQSRPYSFGHYREYGLQFGNGVTSRFLPGDAPLELLAPLQYRNPQVHPMEQLISDSVAKWQQTQQGQSKTLEEAVLEYRRRYGIAPPPNFDKWYDFAKRKGVQLIDEYDSIYHSLLPFWALPPAMIRARTSEALGFNNMLVALLIRDGTARHVEGGQDWLQKALIGMMGEFVEYLPDMDLAFNTHDEPRVVVPHDELSKLVEIAIGRSLRQASSNAVSPKNSFSASPFDANSGRRIAEVKTTRFNVFAHQPTWIPSRLSCSPDSPARALLESDAIDNLTSYALGPLGLVYNQTAFSDVCNSPSFGKTHGFFDRPNAFNVVHDLFPIFSQSKMSSFQDILFPSPWYWFGRVDYNATQDPEWDKKSNKLFWRGSTTGGFSRDGGWRRQHRQHIVRKLNALDTAEIMENAQKYADSSSADASTPNWQLKQVSRQDYNLSMDVHFSHVGQCDPGDCDAQREFFDIAPEVPQSQSWKYRYLLDMDGNAFSGRFYAFLKSRCLTFKMAVFREWHEEWIKPWVHYIPLSLRADEALEAVRYFSHEEEGRRTAMRLAETSREWAEKALRNEDLEAWFFRLLLEYGRLIDDNRAEIGFAGS